MKFAEKLTILRRRRGWSQEELAAQIGVSRQAVSKWESGQSMPDLDKILILSDLFEVSTDTLLKSDRQLAPVTFEDLESNEGDQEDGFGKEIMMADQNPQMPDIPSNKVVDLMSAKRFLEVKEYTAPRMALSVSVLISSVIPLLFLFAIRELGWLGMAMASEMAVGLGLCFLLGLVAFGVYKIIRDEPLVQPYEYLEKESFRLDGQAYMFTEKVKDEWEPQIQRQMATGIVLCILSPIAIFASLFMKNNGSFLLIGVCVLLGFVAVGVNFIVRAITLKEATDILLQEDDYTTSAKKVNKVIEPFAGVYWTLVTAIYLAWSFLSNQWSRTWIIWAVAGILFGALSAGINAYLRQKYSD
ncbi:helix-turn-helix transcriptional regulator [Allobaculum sp. JKK-2023]|uniref:helix-turn-helix domain-containing protein n=1 Tax=Allobaculum sp. JKK-2023 TaxID=3108943 RepID=UPI002B0557A2|nr:helix-turn-helix transcriptional regulator [Allobaculum sp. JKK-2023]